MGNECDICVPGKELQNGECLEIQQTAPRVILKSAFPRINNFESSKFELKRQKVEPSIADQETKNMLSKLRQRLTEEKRRREQAERMMQLYKSKYEGLKRSINNNRGNKQYMTIKRYG